MRENRIGVVLWILCAGRLGIRQEKQEEMLGSGWVHLMLLR